MKLCFIADARSPIAQNWISYFIQRGYEVHLISSYPCEEDLLPVKSLHVVPVAFSQVAKVRVVSNQGGAHYRSLSRPLNSSIATRILGTLRHWVGPLDVFRFVSRVRGMIEKMQPDIVHAMRIPFEGIVAAEALKDVSVPVIISVWGNDFTLFAQRFHLIGALTKRALKRADALHTDCYRDAHIARHWGFSSRKLAIVVPGSGAVRTDVFCLNDTMLVPSRRWDIPQGVHVVLNPRGFRGYVRNDTFFRSIPLILSARSDVLFLGVSMEGHPVAERWIRRLGVEHAVRLLPSVRHNEMAELFRLAHVVVSPSEHDGTPNTLLEAMACGCFPIAGDIESIREWITHGVNGLLCDPNDPQSLAQAVLQALDDTELRQNAREYNLRLITERADYREVMTKAEQFYREVLKSVTRIR
ncbi:MAG: hypothetical protein KatS3mg081_0023 [Gemmatimonadales bacterium]|nr:MAG: hypothetical protein KatS3mg081_0023 [Gemmatimonadales bacterium]